MIMVFLGTVTFQMILSFKALISTCTELSSVAFRSEVSIATPKKMAWWTWATQKIAACSKDPNI